MEQNLQILKYIIKCIKETGNDPRAQIHGYVISGNERYITRNGDARGLIKSVDVSCLEQYVSKRSC